MRIFKKDPDATLDYSFDWSEWLTGGDTIDSYSILISPTTVPALNNDSDSNTTTAVFIFLSGGVVGQVYDVTCRITTVAGRVEDRTMYIRVVER